MMIKKKSNPWARMKYLYVLPLAAVAVAAFARPEISNKLDEISSVKVNDLTSIVKAEEVKSVEISSDEKMKVSGTVLAADTKVPVMGASVIIRGTTNGTLTDLDGKFVLTGLKKDDVIQVSFVGFQTRSVIIKDESPLTILLDDDVQNLEEMVVVGMGAKDGKPAKAENTDVVFDMPLEEAMKAEKQKKETPQEEVIFQVVEQMPEFPGGMQKAMEFLGKNIKYPVAAQEAKIEGRVIVQFVVERDGSVSDAKVMRGVNPELDAEAVRVVSIMPKWNPGKQRGKAVAVKYTMPIMFRLQTPEPKKEEMPHTLQVSLKVDKNATKEDVDMVKNHLRSNFTGVPIVIADDGKKPLIIVDGEVKEGMKLSQISPETIESVSVMKNEAAIAQYGDKANDGVISIATKKNKK